MPSHALETSQGVSVVTLLLCGLHSQSAVFVAGGTLRTLLLLSPLEGLRGPRAGIQVFMKLFPPLSLLFTVYYRFPQRAYVDQS